MFFENFSIDMPFAVRITSLSGVHIFHKNKDTKTALPVILNKSAGMAVNPSVLHYEDTVSNGVKFYFDSIGLKRKIRPVNRLDLNTSARLSWQYLHSLV